jgi:hypothetical protein
MILIVYGKLEGITEIRAHDFGFFCGARAFILVMPSTSRFAQHKDLIEKIFYDRWILEAVLSKL